MLLDHKYQNDFVNNTVGITIDKSKINIVSDETYANNFGVDGKVVNKAIKELVEHRFISPVKENGHTTKDFIINHNYFFRGSVVAYKLWLEEENKKRNNGKEKENIEEKTT